METTCLFCQRPFVQKHRCDQIYCSPSCRQLAYMRRRMESFDASKPLTPPRTSGNKTNKFAFKKIENFELLNSVKIEKRSEDYWIFCHSMFWHTQDFYEKEKNKFKVQIAVFFKGSKDIDKTFTELIERACLAKRHAEEKDSRYIPQPEDWFNINHPQGLSSTERWYSALTKQRKYSPEFNKGLTILAEAIINYADSRNILDIVFYRHQFISLTHFDLLQWYLNAVMHYQFINF